MRFEISGGTGHGIAGEKSMLVFIVEAVSSG